MELETSCPFHIPNLSLHFPFSITISIAITYGVSNSSRYFRKGYASSIDVCGEGPTSSFQMLVSLLPQILIAVQPLLRFESSSGLLKTIFEQRDALKNEQR